MDAIKLGKLVIWGAVLLAVLVVLGGAVLFFLT